jgi:hypothetical protein
MPSADTTLTDEQIADQADEDAFDAEAAIEAVKPARATPGKPDPAAAPEPKPAAAKPDATKPDPAPKPKFVQVTEDQFAAWNAAAAKTASYEKQLSTLHGTTGGLQESLRRLQATPRAGTFQMPKDAFARTGADFPELAEHFRADLEPLLRALGTPGAHDLDPEAVTRLVNERAAQLRGEAEIEALDDDHPDWRKIVGQVNVSRGEKPDPANPYRKWLATKDAAYQQRLNETHSPAVISRSITRFQSETRVAVRPAVASLNAQLADARRGRIAGAVAPRGDGGRAEPVGNDEDAAFASGFAQG